MDCRCSWKCRWNSVGDDVGFLLDAGFVVEDEERIGFVVGDVIGFVVGEIIEFAVVFIVVVEDSVEFLLETWLWM